MTWDKRRKPPADICPGKYCFNWVPPGGSADLSGRTYSSFEEAIAPRADRTVFPQGGCGCPFGICNRAYPVAGSCDRYEPFEPLLERDDLPWFFFIPSTAHLNPDEHQRYLEESQALWGAPEATPGKPTDDEDSGCYG